MIRSSKFSNSSSDTFRPFFLKILSEYEANSSATVTGPNSKLTKASNP